MDQWEFFYWFPFLEMPLICPLKAVNMRVMFSIFVMFILNVKGQHPLFFKLLK